MRKLVFVFALLLMMVGGVMAQDVGVDALCGQLTEAECAPLVAAQTATPSSGSLAFDMSMNMNLGTPGMENIAFRIDGAGSYIADMATFDQMMTMTPDMMTDMTQVFSMFTDMIGALDAGLQMQITLPQELAGFGIPSPLNLNMWLVEGVGYIDLGALGVDPNMTGTFGVELAPLMDALMAQVPSEALEIPGMDEMDLEAFEVFSDMSNFGTITRSDGEVNGVPVAIFTTDIDMAAVMSNPAFIDLIREQAMATGELSGVDEEEFNQVLELLPQMYNDTTYILTQSIGLEDNYVYDVGVDLQLNINLADIAESMGQEMSETDPESINMSMTFNYSQSDFNAVTDVGLPENAQILPPEALGGLTGASS